MGDPEVKFDAVVRRERATWMVWKAVLRHFNFMNVVQLYLNRDEGAPWRIPEFRWRKSVPNCDRCKTM
jgi:hypothetical protein